MQRTDEEPRGYSSLGGEQLGGDPLLDRGPPTRPQLCRVDDAALPEVTRTAPLQQQPRPGLGPVDRQADPAVPAGLIRGRGSATGGRFLVLADADAVLQRDACPASVTTSRHVS